MEPDAVNLVLLLTIMNMAVGQFVVTAKTTEEARNNNKNNNSNTINS